MESGIEVVEEGDRVRIVMPVMPPKLRFGARRWEDRVEAWLTALILVFMGGGTGYLIITMLLRILRPHVTEEKILMGGFFIVSLGLMAGVMLVSLVTQFFPRRVQIVIDRTGVGEKGWFQLMRWGVGLTEVSGVAVCPPTEKWPEWMGGDQMATVRIDGGRIPRRVKGAYATGVAVEAALVVREQIARMRAMAGVGAEGLAVRDDVGVGPGRRSAERILESCGVRMERWASGVRIELKAWRREQGPREDEAYLSLSERLESFWIRAFGTCGGGIFMGLTLAVLDRTEGVLCHTGAIIAVGSMVLGFVLMFGLMGRRATLDVELDGVTRRTWALGTWSRRHWARGEIDGVFVRGHQWRSGGSAGALWVVGIRERSGKEVEMACGWRWTAEAFAEVLERELGMGEKVPQGALESGGR
ncbi:MAG: hypothetical protein ACTHN5_20575 [Phycisphaerae bacterium]